MRSPVSVVIPCYRSADTIERAVRSVAEQTWPPMEVFLVDDASNDDAKTLTALQEMRQKYGDRLHINIISLEKNGGPGTARNAGWEMATQPYIAFLDADDAWHPRKLEIQYGWMESHPDVALTGHLGVWLRSDKQLVDLPEQIAAHAVSGNSLLISNRFATRSVMLRRKIASRFEAGKRYAEDYLLWLDIVLNGQSAWLIRMPLAYSYKADFGGGGLTGNLWKAEKGEIDTYWRVYRRGLISLLPFMGMISFSLLKYVRRLILAVLGPLSSRASAV